MGEKEQCDGLVKAISVEQKAYTMAWEEMTRKEQGCDVLGFPCLLQTYYTLSTYYTLRTYYILRTYTEYLLHTEYLLYTKYFLCTEYLLYTANILYTEYLLCTEYCCACTEYLLCTEYHWSAEDSVCKGPGIERVN